MIKTIASFFDEYDEIWLYAVDPGAYAVFKSLISRLGKAGKISRFFCNGWAKHNSDIPFEDELALKKSLLDIKKENILFVLGSQTSYAETHFWLKFSQELNISSLFIFDHWKNFSQHFVTSDEKVLLPDHIFVPDERAKTSLSNALYVFDNKVLSKLESRVLISGHFSLEDACKKIKEIGDKQKKQFRSSLKLDDSFLILILLDPDQNENEPKVGYTVESIVTYWADYIPKHRATARFIIKPHPRQDKTKLIGLLTHYFDKIHINYCCSRDNDSLEDLLAVADEVWGVTTIGLILSKLLSKPILSFQIGRNAVGLEMSNEYIEPYTIV